MTGHDVSARIHSLPAPPADPDPEEVAREMQAMSEGVETGDTVTCLGKTYLLRDKVGSLPMMRYAAAAASGLDSATMEGLAATWQMLKDCIDPADWVRFVDEQTELQADDQDLFELITEAMRILNARPTKRRSGSSPGPQQTSPTSTGTSSPPAREPEWAKETVPVAEVASRG